MRPETTEHTPTTSTTSSATVTADRGDADGSTPLHQDERTEVRGRWDDIEARFVDDPAGATASADELLDETIDRLTTRWQDHRAQLRDGWDGEDASTEELRTTLKRYRGAIEGLLS